MQKRIFALYLAILCSLTTMAQYADIQAAINRQQFSNEMMDQLKATTTVFFYSKKQGSAIDSIKQAVADGWKLTPLIFDDISKFDKYAANPKYSYFIIEGITKQTSSYSNTYYFLNLRLFKEVTKRGKLITTGLCRIELFPNMQTFFMSGKNDEIIENLYSKGVFYNWTPILLKAQLEAVSANLEKNLKPGHYAEVKDNDLTSILSNDTLYVPASVLLSFTSGKEKENPESFFAGYRYKYRISTDAVLFDLFQTSKKGRLLFEYVKSSTDKFITIYDLQQKKIIYKNYVPLSYNLKSKDIESIK